MLVYTPQKLSVSTGPMYGQSPPTRDTGPKVGSKLSQEIRKLQKELGTCVQRIEQLTNKGTVYQQILFFVKLGLLYKYLKTSCSYHKAYVMLVFVHTCAVSLVSPGPWTIREEEPWLER